MKMSQMKGIYLKVHLHYASFFVMIKEGKNMLFNNALNRFFPSQKKPTKKI